MSIGKNIRDIRTAAGMEQKELADLLHVSNKTVSSWECGRTEPKIGMIEVMSKIFNRPKSDFLQTPVDFFIEDKFFLERPSGTGFKDQLWNHYLNAPANIRAAVEKLLELDEEKSKD